MLFALGGFRGLGVWGLLFVFKPCGLIHKLSQAPRPGFGDISVRLLMIFDQEVEWGYGGICIQGGGPETLYHISILIYIIIQIKFNIGFKASIENIVNINLIKEIIDL